MPIEYRQKADLTKTESDLKIAKDKEYELAVRALSGPYYAKKRSVGVTALETTTYQTAKAKLWGDYLTWAKANGLYDTVTIAQQKVELDTSVAMLLTRLNVVRAELGLQSVTVK